MNDYCCSVCFRGSDLTMIAGTIICKECLEQVKKSATSDTLKTTMAKTIINKENDIYD